MRQQLRRVVRVGRATDLHGLLVQVLRDALGGFDDDHVRYLVQRRVDLWGLIPAPIQEAAMRWLLPKAGIMAQATTDEIQAALREARPGLADLADSPEGAAWLAPIFRDIPHFLKLFA